MRACAPVLAVFLLALLLRLAHVADVRENPFFEHPVVDAAEYTEWARSIARGDFLSRGSGPYWQAPLYPVFLAGVFRLMGEDLLSPRIAQAWVGATACALLFLLGRRAGGTRAGLLAGLGGACYWPWIHFDAELLPAGLLVALDLAAAWSLLRAAGRPGARRGWAAAGVVGGLACVTRPTSLIVTLAAAAWIVAERGSLGGRRAAALAAAAFLAGAAAAILPVTARNALVGHDRVLVASSGGLNFYLGNNPDYDRTVDIRPGARWTRLLMLAPHGPGVSASERSSAFYRLGWRWLAENPRQALALYGRKLLLFANHREILRNQDPYYFRRYSRFLGPPLLGFAPLLPLAALGLARAGRGSGARRLFLFLLLAHVAGVLLFFVTSRYRLPAVPYLLLFAALGIESLLADLRARRRGAAALALALCVGMLALVLRPVRGAGPSTFSREAFELGRIAEERGDLAAARREYEEATRRDASDPDAWLHLAIVQRDSGDEEAALAAIGRALELMPDLGIAHYLTGTIMQRRGEWELAAQAYRTAMRCDPAYDQAEALARLAAVALRLGRLDEAERAARAAVQRAPRQAEPRLLLAAILRAAGREVEALAELRALAAAMPGDPRAAGLAAELERGLEGGEPGPGGGTPGEDLR